MCRGVNRTCYAMNQTRTFLMFALLAVAYLLFIAWEKDYAPRPVQTTAASASSAALPTADGSVPASVPGASSVAQPAAAAIAGDTAHTSQAPSQLISVDTDVL